MTPPTPMDRFGFPTSATDGDLGDEFYEVFGRIIVLAAANERLVELLRSEVEGVGPFSAARRAALPTKQAVERTLDQLGLIDHQGPTNERLQVAVESVKSFMAMVDQMIETRNGYVHSAWLVDDRRSFAENFDRRPEFLALRLSTKKSDRGLVQHDPRNLVELRADLERFSQINDAGRTALIAWRRLGSL